MQIQSGKVTFQEHEILEANCLLVQQKVFPTALSLGLFKPEAHDFTQLWHCPTNLSGISTILLQGCLFSKSAGSIPSGLALSCVQSQH